jgi:TRAP-type C4-dicarboxylate transport system substrate-binding protein
LKKRSGLTLLSFNWYQGARHMLTKKPVSTPADLSGVRVRTIGQPLWVETIGAMGAVATPLPWAEVYPSLQTGVIDGAEAQPAAIWGAKLYEVVSDITLTSHIYLMSGLLVSDAWLQSLPEDVRAIVSEEAKTWGAPALKSNVDGAEKIFADIRATGVNVTAIDTTPFKQAVKPVWDKMELTGLVADVRAALSK